ncbi:MAG: PqqD family peptide modification chaperone [Bacilli bacterium]|jgi:hypothetical protein|nr:PqqD family peptide modification chaperone [Bacilli bacterium]
MNKNKPVLENNEDVLNIIYKHDDNLIYEVNDNGIVYIIKQYNHPIQNFFRKIKFKIPKEKKIELDEKSSFVFLQIDGVKTIKDIADLVDNRFGEKAYPLYENILLFLNHIEVNEKFIVKVNEPNK